MQLPSLRFNGEVLPHNPRELRIEYARDIRQTTVPYCGEIYGDLGRRARIITGKGELFGDDAFEVFLRLAKMHDESAEGVLSIPDIPPMTAVLKELTLIREPKDGVIDYSFKFIEKTSLQSSDEPQRTGLKVSSDCNLWEIAAMYGYKIERLVENNKDIETPFSVIEAGSEVIL